MAEGGGRALNYFWLLFGLKGRINRARYLMVQLALLTIWLLWLKFQPDVAPQWVALLVDWVVTMALIWTNTTTTVKRLHDRNRSGWWAVGIFILHRVAFVYYGLFLGSYFGVDISLAVELLLVMFALALSLLATWVFIELFFLIGTDGPNRFGPDPLRRIASAAAASPGPDQHGIPRFLVRRTASPPVSRAGIPGDHN
jgi:uncharacterized membrane protein YhaH (DUF805 family)